MVDFGAALSELLVEIQVGQSVAQVSAQRDQDDVWREPEPSES
jgi:hypothetical protein